MFFGQKLLKKVNFFYKMDKHLPFHILNQDEVQNMFKKSFQFHKQNVKENLSLAFHDKPFFKNKQTLNLLTQLSIFCAIYHIDESNIYKTIVNANSYQEIKDYFQLLKKEISSRKIEEKKIIKKGLINRLIFGTKLPPLFDRTSRVYIKINKIPTLSFLTQEVLDRLNFHVPKQFFHSIKTLNSKNTLTFFIIDEKKETKIGKFLLTQIQQLEALKNNISALLDDDFEVFKTLFSNDFFDLKKTNHKFQLFFKKRKLPKISFSTSLFFELEKNIHLKKDELIEYISSVKEIYANFANQIQHIQTRTNNPYNQENNTYGDMIILSTNARDIARISEYTSWNTCMGQEDEYCHDLPTQIGVGSIVAYLVNSSNPYKRLARILLKPFVNQETYQKKEALLEFFQTPELKKKLVEFDSLITFSHSIVEEKNLWLPFMMSLKKELLPFNTLPIQEKTIYLADQQYGINHSQFTIFINNILSHYINP